jgi:hypothetical protein
MKKIIILSVLFLFILIVSLSTSCKKEDPKPEGITFDDLIGSWAFMTLEFNGKTTLGCDLALNESYDFVTLDFYDVHWNIWLSSPFMTLNTNCVDSGDEPIWQRDYQFTLVDSVINCNDELKFKIVNIGPYQNVNRTLKLKLIYSSIPDVPLNGIYTLGKTPF